MESKYFGNNHQSFNKPVEKCHSPTLLYILTHLVYHALRSVYFLDLHTHLSFFFWRFQGCFLIDPSHLNSLHRFFRRVIPRYPVMHCTSTNPSIALYMIHKYSTPSLSWPEMISETSANTPVFPVDGCVTRHLKSSTQFCRKTSKIALSKSILHGFGSS